MTHPRTITARHIGCLGAMLEYPTQYTQRCVEQVTFLPDGGQQWTRSLQLRIPEPPLVRPSVVSSTHNVRAKPHFQEHVRLWHVVSLGVFTRRRFPDFIVRDSGGTRLNLLNRHQHGQVLTHASLVNHLRLLRPAFSADQLTTPNELDTYNELVDATYDMFVQAGTVPQPSISRLIRLYQTLITELLPSGQGDEATKLQSLSLFQRWCGGLYDSTRYLCWIEAEPGELVNVEVSYTTSDARRELKADGWKRTLRGLVSKDADTRMEMFRAFGLAPLNYAFKVPGRDQVGSYYFTLRPPPNTEITYLDSERSNSLESSLNELDSAFHAVHIHRTEVSVTSKQDERTIRAYLRPIPRAHKQMAAGALLNLIFVYLVAIGRVSESENAAAQTWLLLTPAALLAFLAEQQRHYYAMATKRQRGVMWFYLAFTIAFVITALFSLPHAAKSSEHWGLVATVTAWLLAGSSLALFALIAPLGNGYQWATTRRVKREMDNGVKRPTKENKEAWWQCYERAILSYCGGICRAAVLFTAFFAVGLAVTDWGRTLESSDKFAVVEPKPHPPSAPATLTSTSKPNW